MEQETTQPAAEKKQEEKKEIESTVNDKKEEKKDYDNVLNVRIEKPSKRIWWNGEVNFGHLFTYFLVIIGFAGLVFQKISYDTKFHDLNEVVQRLENEIFEREIQGYRTQAEILNKYSENLNYTVNQGKDIKNMYSNMLITTMGQINDIIDILKRQKDLSSTEKEILELFKVINDNSKGVLLGSYFFNLSMDEFEKENRPLRENYTNDEEFNKANKFYTDTLTQNTQMLLKKLESYLEEPSEQLNIAYEKYLELKK